MSTNSRIEIEDLIEKSGIEDSNLMIVEDKEDTKKTTVYELKKAFSGDDFDPSENTFYSSKKAKELHDDIKREMFMKASQKSLDELNDKVNSITASAGTGKDTELIAARNGKESLSDRLDFDAEIIESRYAKKIKRLATGKRVDIPGHSGYVDVTIVEGSKEKTRSSNKLVIYSKNLLNSDLVIEVSDQIEKVSSSNGFKYIQKTGGVTTVDIPMPISQAAGVYTFYSYIAFSDTFADKNVKFNITYADGTIESLPYNHSESYKFEAKKSFNKISIDYNTSGVVNTAYVTFFNIMLTSSNATANEFIPYERYSHDMNLGDNLFDFLNKDYIYECNVQSCYVTVSYYDNDITIESMDTDIKEIQGILGDRLDKCGLITDYGSYVFMDKSYISSYPDGISIKDSEDKYNRNGAASKKITISEKATKNSIIRIPLDNPIRVIETLGILFFMNKTDFSLFTDVTGGVRIKLCSDDIRLPTETNYYEYLVSKKEMVQGWNFVKRRLTEFKAIGNPNPNGVQYIAIEICRTDELNTKSLYINGFVFNQKMKPSVLLAFNGTYDESIPYLYPYLQTRGICPTIFLNSKRTLSAEAIDEILKYKILYGWDIGTDGCHPNKEILIQDDNFRNQYLALRNSREWLRTSMVDSPTSYSAPYGNLRPITEPLLRDLGYNIAKTEANTYCGFFSDKDFALPMHLISNTVDSDAIKRKIDYAIESNQTVILYTNDVTEYGSEIDSKKITLESVIDYIQEKVKAGDLQCLTFKDFYDKCTK